MRPKIHQSQDMDLLSQGISSRLHNGMQFWMSDSLVSSSDISDDLLGLSGSPFDFGPCIETFPPR